MGSCDHTKEGPRLNQDLWPKGLKVKMVAYLIRATLNTMMVEGSSLR